MQRMDENIPFLCNDISRLFRKRFDELARKFGSTGAQWRTLLVIQRVPGISQGALAERMDVEPITACRMVDRMEQAGLVQRRRDPDDRRIWQLYLTPEAEPVLAELKQIGEKMLEWVTSELDEERRVRLTRELSNLRNKLAGDGGPAIVQPIGQEA